MPNLRFAVEDRGGAQALEHLRRAVSDLRPAWAQIIEAFKVQQRELFAGEGREAGGWEPLDPAYARWKAKRFPGRGILQRTGKLAAAATGASSDFLVVSQPLLLMARVMIHYATWIDRRREISPLTDARRRVWLRILNEHLQRAGSGLSS